MKAAKKKRADSGVKKKRQDAWLEAFKKTYTILGACEAIGISRQTAFIWQKEAVFSKRFDDLKLDIVDRLKNKGLVKALHEGDNDMIKFFLRAYGPEFSDKMTVEHSGAGGKPLIIHVVRYGEKPRG